MFLLYRLVLLMAFLAMTYGNVVRTNETQLVGRIVGGQNTNISQYRHQISVTYRGIHLCGGIIITAKCVLTAAHCIRLTHLHGIRYGSTNVNSGTSVSVLRTLKHPNYNSNTHDYDIALMYPSISIEFGSTAAPIALAIEIPAPNSIAIVTGWGATTEGAGSTPNVLQKVQVPVVDTAACNITYDNAITSRMICAGINGRDSCQGDSGGPLVFTSNNQTQLIGVVSWGKGCGRSGFPGVYVSVPSVRHWIVENSCL